MRRSGPLRARAIVARREVIPLERGALVDEPRRRGERLGPRAAAVAEKVDVLVDGARMISLQRRLRRRAGAPPAVTIPSGSHSPPRPLIVRAAGERLRQRPGALPIREGVVLAMEATHSRRSCPVVSHSTARRSSSTIGLTTSDRWASARCKYTEVAMAALSISTTTTSTTIQNSVTTTPSGERTVSLFLPEPRV
jgi:hypothetical protein